MRIIIVLFFINISSIFSQQLDYNTKKGFVAHGYDVVAYFENTAIEGSEEFTTTHDGVNYKFASKEHLNSFLKNQKKYVPQYGGYCAYAVAVNSKKVKINPETFEIRNAKLYLFYNAWGTNTLELWKNEDVAKLLQQADKNWKAIMYK